jgi:hypothetical protein
VRHLIEQKRLLGVNQFEQDLAINSRTAADDVEQLQLEPSRVKSIKSCVCGSTIRSSLTFNAFASFQMIAAHPRGDSGCTAK